MTDDDPFVRAAKKMRATLRGLGYKCPEPAPRPESYGGLTLAAIQDVYRQLEEEDDKRPTRLRVAAALHTSEATLKRAQRVLGKPRWPPF